MFERENVDIIIPTIASKKFTRTYQSPNVSPISPLLHLALHSFSFYLRGVFYAPFFFVAKIGSCIVMYLPSFSEKYLPRGSQNWKESLNLRLYLFNYNLILFQTIRIVSIAHWRNILSITHWLFLVPIGFKCVIMSH